MAKITETRSQRRWVRRTLFGLAYAVPLVGLAVFGGYYYQKYHDLRDKSPDQLAQAQVDGTLSDIGKLYSLPKDEKPVVATVKDRDAYKKQYPNFGDANNGDVLVVYTKAQLAILYRPGEKRLIKVGPVNVQADVAVSVYGPEAARAAALQSLTAAQQKATDGGAGKTTQATTTIVDVTGKNGERAKAIAELLKGQVGSLPQGEETPKSVDIAVYVGGSDDSATSQ